jgi:NAD+ synthase
MAAASPREKKTDAFLIFFVGNIADSRKKLHKTAKKKRISPTNNYYFCKDTHRISKFNSMATNNSFSAESASNQIVNWLKQYALDAKSTGFVVGISGGIDSAVTSSLCALTGLDVLCVTMPIHQAESHVSRAYEHIKHLQNRFPNVQHSEANLTPLFDAFQTQLPSSSDSDKLQLTLANTRARLRMTTLYYFAGIHGRLVAGTGNKIEDFGVGFYTKYGDGGVDLSPIADLLKSEVFALGAHLGVVESILNAAPTDGLFGDDRTDEEQLGASYNELEWAMTAIEMQFSSAHFTSRQQEVMAIYQRLHKANQHKMNPIPVCHIKR